MRTCKVEGCNNKHDAKGYCSKHYKQIARHGRILNRTYREPNEIIVHKDYAELILYKGRDSVEVARTQISLCDIEKVKKFKWTIDKDGYAITNNKGKRLSLHRYLLEPKPNIDVDHIDHNRLNNRRENIRLCTRQQNIFNISNRCDNSSGCKGVSWLKSSNKWRAVITISGETKHLGVYTNLEDAIKARKKAEKKYFKEFSN